MGHASCAAHTPRDIWFAGGNPGPNDPPRPDPEVPGEPAEPEFPDERWPEDDPDAPGRELPDDPYPEEAPWPDETPSGLPDELGATG